MLDIKPLNVETKRSHPSKMIIYENGRFYFTKMAERKFYFVLTLIMLVAGILYKMGIL
jgi:hypothetical protein